MNCGTVVSQADRVAEDEGLKLCEGFHINFQKVGSTAAFQFSGLRWIGWTAAGLQIGLTTGGWTGLGGSE